MLLLNVPLNLGVHDRLVGVRGEEAPSTAEAGALYGRPFAKPDLLVSPFSHRSPSRQKSLDPAAALLWPELGAVTALGMASKRQRMTDECFLDCVAAPVRSFDVLALAETEGHQAAFSNGAKAITYPSPTL